MAASLSLPHSGPKILRGCGASIWFGMPVGSQGSVGV